MSLKNIWYSFKNSICFFTFVYVQFTSYYWRALQASSVFPFLGLLVFFLYFSKASAASAFLAISSNEFSIAMYRYSLKIFFLFPMKKQPNRFNLSVQLPSTFFPPSFPPCPAACQPGIPCVRPPLQGAARERDHGPHLPELQHRCGRGLHPRVRGDAAPAGAGGGEEAAGGVQPTGTAAHAVSGGTRMMVRRRGAK